MIYSCFSSCFYSISLSYDSESTYGHLDGFKKKTTIKNDVSMGDLIVDFVTVILDGNIRMETSIRRVSQNPTHPYHYYYYY